MLNFVFNFFVVVLNVNFLIVIKMDSDFSSYSFEVLLNEPSRLEKSISFLKDQFDESMTSNYDFFIKTCENATTITDDLEACSENIAKLSSSISSSIDLCSDLCLTAQNTVNSNSKISSAFRHLPQITDILNIPQLMRTCRISSFYEEALQLYQAIDRFARQYPGIASIQSTLEEAQSVKNDVAQTLIDSFSKKLKLTDALSAVTLLRRSGIHTEGELRLAFVNGRRKKLQQKIENLNFISPLSYFENFTKHYRSALYKICNLYRALFNNNATPLPNIDGVGDSNNKDDDDDLTLHLAFQQESQNYCNELKKILEQITDVNDARLAMQSALYFMNSLGKLGFDFCPLVEYEFRQSKWGKKNQ